MDPESKDSGFFYANALTAHLASSDCPVIIRDATKRGTHRARATCAENKLLLFRQLAGLFFQHRSLPHQATFTTSVALEALDTPSTNLTRSSGTPTYRQASPLLSATAVYQAVAGQ